MRALHGFKPKKKALSGIEGQAESFAVELVSPAPALDAQNGVAYNTIVSAIVNNADDSKDMLLSGFIIDKASAETNADLFSDVQNQKAAIGVSNTIATVPRKDWVNSDVPFEKAIATGWLANNPPIPELDRAANNNVSPILAFTTHTTDVRRVLSAGNGRAVPQSIINTCFKTPFRTDYMCSFANVTNLGSPDFAEMITEAKKNREFSDIYNTLNEQQKSLYKIVGRLANPQDGFSKDGPKCASIAIGLLPTATAYSFPAVGYCEDIPDRKGIEGEAFDMPNVVDRFVSHEDMWTMIGTGTRLTNKMRMLPTRSPTNSIFLGAEPYMMASGSIDQLSNEFLKLCKNNIVSRPVIGNTAVVTNGFLNPLQFNYFSAEDIRNLKTITTRPMPSGLLPEEKKIFPNTAYKLNQAIRYTSYIDQIARPEPAEDGTMANTSYGGNGAYSLMEKNARIAWQASIDKSFQYYNLVDRIGESGDGSNGFNRMRNTATIYEQGGMSEEKALAPRVTLLQIAASDKSHFLDVRLPRVSGDLGTFYAYGYSERSYVALVTSRPMGKDFKRFVEALSHTINTLSSTMNNDRRFKVITKAFKNPKLAAKDALRDKISDQDLDRANLPFVRLTDSSYSNVEVIRSFVKNRKLRNKLGQGGSGHPFWGVVQPNPWYIGGNIYDGAYNGVVGGFLKYGRPKEPREGDAILPQKLRDIGDLAPAIDAMAIIGMTSLPLATFSIVQSRFGFEQYSRVYYQMNYWADVRAFPLYDLSKMSLVLNRNSDSIGLGDMTTQEVLDKSRDALFTKNVQSKFDWMAPYAGPIAYVNNRQFYRYTQPTQKVSSGFGVDYVAGSDADSIGNPETRQLINEYKDLSAWGYKSDDWTDEGDFGPVWVDVPVVPDQKAFFGMVLTSSNARYIAGGVAFATVSAAVGGTAIGIGVFGTLLTGTAAVGVVITGIVALVVGVVMLFNYWLGDKGNWDEHQIDSVVIGGVRINSDPDVGMRNGANNIQRMESPYSVSRALNMEPYRGEEMYGPYFDSKGVIDYNLYPDEALSNLRVPQIPGLIRNIKDGIRLFKPFQHAGTNTSNKPSAQEDNLSVKLFSLCEYPDVASALVFYYKEATKKDDLSSMSNSFNFDGRFVPYFQSLGVTATEQGDVQAGPVTTSNSFVVAQKEFYALRYIALLGSVFEWLLSNDNPASTEITKWLRDKFEGRSSPTEFEIYDVMLELFKIEYASPNYIPRFSSAAQTLMNLDLVKKNTRALIEVIGEWERIPAGERGISKEEYAYTRFFRMTLGETAPFLEMFKERLKVLVGIQSVGVSLTRAEKIKKCQTDSDLIAHILNNTLPGAPIKDYLESLGMSPGQIVERLCDALTNGGLQEAYDPRKPNSVAPQSYLILSQEADLFDQSRIHATISLMTAGAVAPAEWVQRLGASGALAIQTLPIANKEAFVAQIARTAAESGITDVKGLLEDFLPPEATADIDVDTVIEQVGADVTLEQTAIDKAEFEAQQEAAELSGISTAGKIGIAVAVAGAIAGGYWFYKNKMGKDNTSSASDEEEALALDYEPSEVDEDEEVNSLPEDSEEFDEEPVDEEEEA